MKVSISQGVFLEIGAAVRPLWLRCIEKFFQSGFNKKKEIKFEQFLFFFEKLRYFISKLKTLKSFHSNIVVAFRKSYSILLK